MATPAQTRKALAAANRVKVAGRAARKQMRTGKLSLGDVLHDPNLQGFRLGVVLGWQQGRGPQRNGRMLAAAEVRSSFLERPVGDLTARQKMALAAWAEPRDKRRFRRKHG